MIKMAEQFQKRATAAIVSINELKNGVYEIQEGWNPNYVVLPSQEKISRVNIIGIVIEVSPEGQNPSCMIDDGTGTIQARSFEPNDMYDELDIGDPVLMIARPREFNNSIYLSPEIIKRIDNPSWIRYRKEQLAIKEKLHAKSKTEETKKYLKENLPIKEDTKEEDAKEEIVEIDETLPDRMVALIQEMDKGEGADYEEAITTFNQKNDRKDGDSIVQGMLKRGELFEIKGRLKVLD